MRRLLMTVTLYLGLGVTAFAQSDNNPKILDSRFCVGQSCTVQNSVIPILGVADPTAGLFVTQVRSAPSATYPFLTFRQRTTANGSNVHAFTFDIDSSGNLNLKDTVAGITPLSIAATTGSPTWLTAPTFTALTASRLVVTDASKALASNGSITTNALAKSASSGASLAASALSDDASNITSTEPIIGPAGSGTDAAGTALTLAGGVGTGAGVSGALVGKVAPPAATGSSANSLATAFSFGGSSYAVGNWAQVSGGAAAGNSTVNGVNGAGTNQVGGNLTFAGGTGTGTGTPGVIAGRVAPALATGTTAGTLQTVFNFAGNGFTIGNWNAISGGAAAGNSSIQGENSAGTDATAGNLTLAAGQSTGAGTAGALIGQVSPPAATGSSANSLATAFNFGGVSYTIGGYSQVSGGAAAAASTIKGVSAAGTNQVGGNFTVLPGAGTGTGAGTKTALQRNLVTTTGSSAQAQQDGFIICESKTMSNTTATLTTMAQIATSSNTGGSATIFYGTTASDGTNLDSDSASMNVAWVNKAGTVTTAVGTLSSIAQASNSGSVASTATAPAVGVNVNLSLAPAYTTLVPTTVTSYMTIVNHGPATITCQ